MGKGGGGKQTIKSEPWKNAKPFLQDIMGDASKLYGEGGFSADPYGGARVAPQSAATRGAYDAIMDRGANAYGVKAAGGAMRGMLQNGGVNPSLTGGSDMLRGLSNGNIPNGMMDGSAMLRGMAQGDPRLARMTSGKDIYRDLEGVKNNALGSAIPAAVSMFSGSGMTDSSTAMDAVGRAATEAVAPIDYGAWQTAQDRALAATGQDNATRMAAQGQNFSQRLGALGQDAQTMMAAQGQNFDQRLGAAGLRQQGTLGAAGMMPGLQEASYLPAQMMARAGQGRDAYNQSSIAAMMQKYYEGEGKKAGNLGQYANMIGGMAGMGGQQTGPAQGGGGSQIGAAGLGGLGTFGALAGIPGIGLPLAGVGGGLAALMGLL